MPVCSSPLLYQKSIPDQPGNLNNYTLLHVIGYEEGWGHWLKQLGYHSIDASQGIHFDSLMTAMEMAAHGHGIALSRSSLAAEMLKSGRLIAPFNESVAAAESFFLVTPSNKPIQSHAQKFKDWLIEMAAKGC